MNPVFKQAGESADGTPGDGPKRSSRAVADLERRGLTDPADTAQLQAVAERFAVAITPAMLDLIEPERAHDPIAAQFVPSTAELEHSENDLADPIGDERHSPVPGIVHRYPDRLLLTPTRICPVYCRFCFRRETVGRKGGGSLSAEELEAALEYIAGHEEVWEVILSGGDPLILSPRRLRSIIQRLDGIPHVKVIRIHTRVPVVSPESVSARLIESLHTDKALFVVLHSNHPRELTGAARRACARFIDSGIPMLSQSVLLKGVNDDASTLERLLRGLVENRIKPYYLHHADRAPGTAHFRTTLKAGQSLMEQLQGRMSGLCQPEYVLDIPGGAGKIPACAPRTEHLQGPLWRLRDYLGNEHVYSDDIGADGDFSGLRARARRTRT